MSKPTVGSLFSGIGAFDLALERVGWEVAWQVENDPACRRVLARHWPDVPQYGDIRDVDGAMLPPVELLVGGWPCVDHSVAGKRAGLAGERSGLFHHFARLVAECRPRFLLAENVPGLLSQPEDFRTVLTTLDDLGYVGGWRVLDARYFGVAQRRRRVFFVAGAGADGARAAAVLFEPESGRRHPAESREARPRVAASLTAGAHRPGVNEPGRHHEDDVNLVYQCHGNNVGPMGTLRQGNGGLTSGVPFVAHALSAHGRARLDPNGEDWVLAFDTTQVTSDSNYSNPKPGDPCHPLAAGAHAPAIATGPVVRRLTPRECERLMALPDDWTAGESESDSTRYRMLGNSCVVPVVQWIGARILAER